LSTLSWFDGPLNALKFDVVQIQFASINFKDVMVASGKINMDDLFTRIEQQCVMGFEFSGVTDKGRRVMGMSLSGGLATHMAIDASTVYDVPDNWSLEQAATVPVVYLTVYLAFFMKSQIKKGDSVLIHAGSGGVGLAAIQVAFAYGLEVFSTVGSEEKKKFLLETFPQLKSENIGNSRDTSFEEMVLVATKGRGVDYVLNSLADDKLQASLRCLAVNGTFLEIGKYDIKNKTKIHMGHFEKEINFKAVFLDLKNEEVT
jgi:fatty acid synthase, animal type